MSEREAFAVRCRSEQTGDQVEVTLTVDLPVGMHIEPHRPAEPYLIPTVLDVEGLGDVTVRYPAAVAKDVGWKDLTLTVLEGSLTFVVRGRVPAGLDRVRGTLRYQPCVGGACLPPRAVDWESPLAGTTTYSILRAGAARAEPVQPSGWGALGRRPEAVVGNATGPARSSTELMRTRSSQGAGASQGRP